MSAFLTSMRRSADCGRRRLIDYEPDTRAQAQWIGMQGTPKRFLWRAANQVGKSRGAAKKLIKFIRRQGPYRNRRPGPVKILVVSFSKEQMEPFHQKIWELLPKDEISSRVEFEPGFGFRGKPPRVTFTSGPGKGSVIVFATYKQGSRRVAGGTYDVVVCDEPLSERMWGELPPRVLHGNPGEIWVTFTPTPDSPDLTYLRDMVKRGEVREMNTHLSLEAVRVMDERGRAGRPLLTQEQIDAYTGGLLELEKDMRLRGGWDIVSTKRALDKWGPHCVVASRPPAGAWLMVGIDHGAASGRQAAALLAVVGRNTMTPRVWLMAETVGEGFTTPEMDAEAILAMLKSVGLNYDHVDEWIGDRASGMNRYEVRKSNTHLRVHLAAKLGRKLEAVKEIPTPRKWDDSVTYGIRLINGVMGRFEQKSEDGPKIPHFIVAPTCPKFIAAAGKWNWNMKAPEKDILDAVRYPLQLVIQPTDHRAFAMLYA